MSAIPEPPRVVRVAGVAAVPIGGTRRGGFVTVRNARHGQQVMTALRGQDGFPCLRFVAPADPEVFEQVQWGEDPPIPPELDAPDEEWALFNARESLFYGNPRWIAHKLVARQFGTDVADFVMRQLQGGPQDGSKGHDHGA